ncbi:tetratricopeptide repeat protein [Desulfobulbus alkaliphilus]|uniref:tetratricopeptide repeat protein n=1 Tax=Desulfobulbus alkaliphilus TaxID=869814 RepID=UPI00196572FC|nr:tetratricopeptide repeat protein [Desulfobulbus alkaliphilus]
MSNHFQPLDSLCPMGGQSGDTDQMLDQARKDYREGRTLLGKSEFGAAAMAFHNALKGFEEQGDEQGIANASDRLGDVCLARGEYALAITHYQRAHVICEKEDDSFSQLALNKKMTAAYRKLEEHDKALELLFDMLEHYRLTNNPKGAVEIMIGIAEVYNEQGERAKAADTYRSIAGIHSRFKHTRLAEEFNLRAAALEQKR